MDPSRASRCLLPLTSHKRVSQEEHEIILWAMTCRNIMDQDTIQECVMVVGAPTKGSWGSFQAHPSCADAGPSVTHRALEADCYNCITTTYFLLVERMLQERMLQEKLGTNISIPPLTQDQLTGHVQLRGQGPSQRCQVASPPAPSCPPLPTGADISSRQPPGTLLKILAVDTTITKSTLALQQICEEEEEDEEDEGRPSTMERKSSLLNQEQM